MEIIGVIKMIDKTKAFGANGFRKREMAISTEESYPQTILIEFTQDKCGLLDKYEVGQSVKVGINLRGREWVNPQGETKYFNTIQGWQIFSNENKEPQHGYQAAPQQPTQQTYTPPAAEQQQDDLPF